jgi:hypothetical protein
MLKNFIKTSDLQKFYPNISNNLWKNVSDYSQQIEQAFEKVQSDLLAKNIDSRKVMIPYTLASNATVTTSITGDWILTPTNYKRLFVQTSNSTVDNSFALQGSNDKQNIFDVVTLTVNGDGNTDTIITDAYKYYRIVITGTATATAEIYETVFDRAIVECAFIYIYRDFLSEAGDTWDIKRQFAEADYDNTINGLKFYFDQNDNQNPADDEPQQLVSITLVR